MNRDAKTAWSELSKQMEISKKDFDLINELINTVSSVSEQHLNIIFSEIVNLYTEKTISTFQVVIKLVEFTKKYFSECAKNNENGTAEGLSEYIKKIAKKEASKIKINSMHRITEKEIDILKSKLKKLEQKYSLYADDAFKDITFEAKEIMEKNLPYFILDDFKGKKIDIIRKDIEKIAKWLPEIKLHENYLIDISSPVTQQTIEEYKAGILTTPIDLADKYGIDFQIFKKNISDSLGEMCSEITTCTLIDTRNENISQAIKKTLLLHPKKSEYSFNGFGMGFNETKNIPVKYLESLGFGTEKKLIKLIQNKKIEGKLLKTKNGQEYHVTINNKKILEQNQTARIVFELRDKNPYIYSLKNLGKELQLSKEYLVQALCDEELEIIPEYLTPYDKEQKYINILTPKNKTFYLKRKTELEIQAELLQKKKDVEKSKKIEQFDFNQRIQGVRSKLAWMFMPITKAVASDLAKQDGYLCSLLAKADDSEAELTKNETIKIKSYYKQVWTAVGTEEQKQAYKKANEIIKIFKEQGLNAIDEKYLPIFEMYGFILD